MPTTSPGPGYVWVSTPGASGDGATNADDGYWMAPGDPNAQKNYDAGGKLTGWVLPKPPGASYFDPTTGNPWVTPGLQRSLEQFLRTPTSGYGDYYGVQNYGAQLPRWQFSNSAPVPLTAPVGWGRYPGVGGSPGPAPWVTNGNAQANTGASGTWTSNNGVPSGGYQNPTGLPKSNAGNVPANVTPPSPTGWMPGPATSQVPQGSLSGFTFQNAAPGSVQDTFNRLQAQRGPQEAIQFLMLYGQQRPEGRGTQSPMDQYIASLQSSGMSREDTNRILNQFSASGSGGMFNNGLPGFDATFGMRLPGLLQSVGSTFNPIQQYTSRYGAMGGRRST